MLQMKAFHITFVRVILKLKYFCLVTTTNPYLGNLKKKGGGEISDSCVGCLI